MEDRKMTIKALLIVLGEKNDINTIEQEIALHNNTIIFVIDMARIFLEQLEREDSDYIETLMKIRHDQCIGRDKKIILANTSGIKSKTLLDSFPLIKLEIFL
ncbi:hypothetical protein CO134_01760 [Candidatus Kuenenbacteria bacterium CG_4_9_14_3_um_filter_39_14]|uniref:Uncharacterized protein n=6 Tax=Candidatus Kueneniibacteriota TaxID=1752740 RepID=A0A2M7IMB8_9BACT|nr:MAG: hypothetical protein AUK13_01015 [Candidatus Kuenenbacteria bacterium CG2_30_39_24]PIP75648.1 MAG: hypothetical protein COW86_02585 [Candidatus Kuenenbacteria bacterium CG22_combo_CG10-13_8_21_14_all_39_9]PIR80953.1 MAG: hypothetical protein COU24_01260 [Candidatus Kuenenbacteria bacterium CG10_big_fil_rev_8_21_14_0_10_39_14]PIW95931.1 MAG: hypothetical protein COZ84_00850 [Candidatus Kuenenbacteria bacterium CG_4_8_14_3_um_filter_39_15]PIX92628.1 MAG: hypothetical protein COZ26_00780 [